MVQSIRWGRSLVAVVGVLAVGCAASPPPVAATEADAVRFCKPQQPWEECFPEVRWRTGETVRDERGPVQIATELAVAFCAEREPWPSCIEKIRVVSAADKDRAACKANPKAWACKSGI